MLNRIATVKDDGTVEFEVPVDVEPRILRAGSESIYTEVDEEALDATDIQYIPPLQIVMLIVGTRGDVQPFVAIGKRLQVESILHWLLQDMLNNLYNLIRIHYSLMLKSVHVAISNYVWSDIKCLNHFW